ncbi:phosphotransferase system, EIIB [Gleimia coleocanis DSM 15436]|uniref:Phosphotransferase system, EIIB n=2 Tax=Gleimia TaxID=2692113 RepID=C0VYE4_9ACTO|nr:phosphotransferase system, EIIB [Gleimia coleocanis DSM 15436]
MLKKEQVQQLIEALGGSDNIEAVEPCITRLRFEIIDPAKVDVAKLRQPLCYGATVLGKAVQVIVGPEAEILLDDFVEQLG